jgi:transmembrane sensor
MEVRRETEDDAETVAARWFARERSGAMSRAQREAFAAWLGQDHDHCRAYEQCKAAWTDLQVISADPSILKLRERIRLRARWRWVGVGAIVAAASVLVAVAVPLYLKRPDLGGGLETASEQPVRFGTGVGQVSRIVLADGSTLVLDADSALSVKFNGQRRDITLERGRAFFHVAHEGRPFIVAGGQFAVRATGTQFVVDRSDEGQSVSMIEGSVVATPIGPGHAGKSVALTAGNGLVDEGQGRWRLTKIDRNAEQDWIDGRLTFDQARVAHIADEMNRYGRRKVVISDPRLADSRLSAVLKAGDTETFVSAVCDLKLGRVVSRDANTVVLAAR